MVNKNNFLKNGIDNKPYYKSLEGFRGIAVIFVLLIHAHFQYGKGGGIGVEIFFTISGFLITNNLLDEIERNGNISLKNFWLSRAFRLLPALYIFLFVVTIFTMLFVDKILSAKYFQEVFESSVFISNFSWFWSNNSQEKFIGHTWSLSVELQFYFIWPTILIKFRNYLNRSVYVMYFSIFIFIITLLKALGFLPGIFGSIFHHSLFCGCILALGIKNGLGKNSDYRFMTWVSFIIIILIGIFKIDFKGVLFEHNGIYILPVFVSFIILFCIFPSNSYLYFILSSRPLRFIGKISYSLYLWHLPIFRIFKHHLHLSPTISFISKFLLTLSVSIFSYYFIERKMIKFGKKYLSKI